MKCAPFLGEEDAVCHGSVSVSVCVMIQADHIALGDIVEDGRGEEGEEAHDAAKNSLHGEALDTQSRLQQNLWHNQQTGPTGAIREKLYACHKTTVRKRRLPHGWLLENIFHTCYTQVCLVGVGADIYDVQNNKISIFWASTLTSFKAKGSVKRVNC